LLLYYGARCKNYEAKRLNCSRWWCWWRWWQWWRLRPRRLPHEVDHNELIMVLKSAMMTRTMIKKMMPLIP